MRRSIRTTYIGLVLLSALLSPLTSACRARTEGRDAGAAAPAPVDVAVATAVEEPIRRFIRVTGSLVAEDQAAVGAETAGRVIETPIERGTPVHRGDVLVRISPVETEA